jgi:hypothetical protein
VGFEKRGGATRGRENGAVLEWSTFTGQRSMWSTSLDIYAKAVKEDLTPADKEQLKELANRLKGGQ